MRIVFSAILLLLVLVNQAIAASEAVRKISDSTIRIEGPLGAETFAQVKAKFDSAITTLSVDSEGGLTSAGLDIAEFMLLHNLNVIVNGVCLSSCANYIFVAGRKKTLTRDSIVGWHGGYSNAESRGNRSLKPVLLKLEDVAIETSFPLLIP